MLPPLRYPYGGLSLPEQREAHVEAHFAGTAAPEISSTVKPGAAARCGGERGGGERGGGDGGCGDSGCGEPGGADEYSYLGDSGSGEVWPDRGGGGIQGGTLVAERTVEIEG